MPLKEIPFLEFGFTCADEIFLENPFSGATIETANYTRMPGNFCRNAKRPWTAIQERFFVIVNIR
ncbi:hypothetical protein [Anabaena sp. CCY 0017]|uniref:hypothetical protein n=1 Tax=Anabaena sp. CCY 0017 TaxID=3103866 RepID=UPI0039C69A25